MPEIHRNNPNRSTHPLSLRPTRRDGSRTAPTTPQSQKYPLPQQPSPPSPQQPPPTTTRPLSREPSPSPSQGEIKRGSQGEGNGAAKGLRAHPNHHPPTSPQHPLPHHPILPILPNHSHPSSGVSQSTPISKHPFSAKYPYFPTQHLTGTALLY